MAPENRKTCRYISELTQAVTKGWKLAHVPKLMDVRGLAYQHSFCPGTKKRRTRRNNDELYREQRKKQK
jgi:hypothetical protein